MKWIGGVLTQSAADTRTQIEIPTSLGVVDQRTIWEIYALDIYWTAVGGMNNVNNAFSVGLVLSAVSTDTNYGDPGEIIRWARNRITASGGASPTASKTGETVDPISREELIIPYPYANTKLYLTLSSTATSAAQQIRYKLFYEEKKVSEVEFFKLQSGFCVC